MGDKVTLAKARQELEALYLGVPDNSVDLSFKDLASFQQNDVAERKISNMEPIHERPIKDSEDIKGLNKVPSLDFAKALQEARDHHRRVKEELSCSFSMSNKNGLGAVVESGQGYDASAINEERGGRGRPGIPHSNICALCSDYIYIFRNRCLVCGRVYCRKCVGDGMGEMTEGRKCVECLGRRFSQRYIQRAGQTGCCWRHPSAVKQQELKWAEKGPRRSGERRYGRSSVASRSRSPAMRGTPSRSYVSRSRSPVMPRTGARSHVGDEPASFVMSSTYSNSLHGLPI